MTEFRTGNFQILPPVIKNLIIINVLVFLAQQLIGDKLGFSLDDVFALHTWQSDLFKPWQFITHLFMHADGFHILFNMLALWSFGSVLENLWGPKRFLIFYFVCGLGAALCHMSVLFIENQNMIHDYNQLLSAGGNASDGVLAFVRKYGDGNVGSPQQIFNYRLDEATIGASGAVFGCLVAFGYLFPNALIIGFPIFIPIKAKWVVGAYAAIELFSAIQNSAGDNVAHVAHLGGALVGFILVYYWNKNNRKSFY